jgi:DNA-binding transcriptional LysR family regulator
MAADRLDEHELESRHDRLVFVAARERNLDVAAIEYRQLRYFVSVAEELHFGRAATRLFVSQPALSQAIARLEQALGVRLFLRTRHSVELTDAGVELLRHARRLLADRADVVERVRQIGYGEVGVLRLGVALMAEDQVGPALVAFAGECPGIVLDRSAAVSERLIAEVRDGTIHAALAYPVPVLASPEGVEWEEIRQGLLAILVSKASALAGRDYVTLGDLSEETFVVNSRELAPAALEGLRHACLAHAGFDPKILESTSTLPLGASWEPVAEGAAIALVPEATAQTVEAETITAVPLRPPPLNQLVVAWRDGDRSPVLDQLLAFIRTYRDDHGWIQDPPA